MKQNNIQSKIRKRWKTFKSTSKKLTKYVPNLVNQNFTASEENISWATDITYIPTKQGWLYLSAIMDLYSRCIVGLGMGNRIDAYLVIRSLNQAICHSNPRPGLILHSDRGTQYSSYEYKKLLSEHEIIPSMSAAGNCYDNAAMESFFHTLKTEHVFLNDFATREQAMRSIFEYVEVFYNRQRIHSTLNYLSPAQFEQQNLKLKESRVKLALPAIEVNL